MLLASSIIHITTKFPHTSNLITRDCAAGEDLRICRPGCEPTCLKPKQNCSLICSTAKCVCLKGFVRHNGLCIPKEACRLFSKVITSRLQKKAPLKKPLTKLPLNALSSTTTEVSTLATMKTLVTASPIIIKPENPPPICGKAQQYTLCVCDSMCDAEVICSSCFSGCGCFLRHVRNANGDCVPKRTCSENSATSPPTSFSTFYQALSTKGILLSSSTGPTPPSSTSLFTAISLPLNKPTTGIRGPPAITPFIFYRHRRIERKKKALRKLMLKL